MNHEGSMTQLAPSPAVKAGPVGPRIVRRVTDLIPTPPSGLRDRLADMPATASARRQAWSLCTFFDLIEAGGSPVPSSSDGSCLRVASWNAERCKFIDESAELIRSAGVDVVLLAEADRGMARSGGHHTAKDLAERLGWSYLFGVEFVELGLGDTRERHWHRGDRNPEGLHGNAILSRFDLIDPVLIRLDDGEAWFAEPADGQRRVGGRMALGARVRVGGTETALFAVHVESRSGPDERANQMNHLLRAIDVAYPDGPVVIGGDFNTCTLVRPQENSTGNRIALAAADPQRFVRPVPFEPLFDVARANGYDWQTSNLPDRPTQRTRPDGTPVPPLGKLDWFLTRDLIAQDATQIAAVNAEGAAISDHDMITATVRISQTP